MIWHQPLANTEGNCQFTNLRELLPKLPEKPTIFVDSINPLALAPLVSFMYKVVGIIIVIIVVNLIYKGTTRVAKNMLPAFMEAANILKVVNIFIFITILIIVNKVVGLSEGEGFGESRAENGEETEPLNFDSLEEEIDAVMKDVETLEAEMENRKENNEESDEEKNKDEEKKEEEMKTKDTQNDDNVEVRGSPTRSLAESDVYHEEMNLKGAQDDHRTEEFSEDGSLSCNSCSFVTSAKKRSSRNFAMKRHKKNAHGEDGFMGKPFKKEKVDVGEAKSLEGQNEFKAEMNGGRDQDETMEEERELEDNLTKSAPNNIQVEEGMDLEEKDEFPGTDNNDDDDDAEDDLFIDEKLGENDDEVGRELSDQNGSDVTDDDVTMEENGEENDKEVELDGRKNISDLNDGERDTTSNEKLGDHKIDAIKGVSPRNENIIVESLPCNFCSFASNAKKGHNRNTALKRHMKVFHPEKVAEVEQTQNALQKENDSIASTEVVEKDVIAEATSLEEKEKTSTDKETDTDSGELLEDELKSAESTADESIPEHFMTPSMEVSSKESFFPDDSMKRLDEGESVMSEDFPEKLPCEKCNFVTSAKSKKDRVSGLKRHMKSQHPEALVNPTVTEEINSENIELRNTAGNPEIPDAEDIKMEGSAEPKIENKPMDESTDEGIFNEQSSEENLTDVSSLKVSADKACTVCGWASKSVSKNNQVHIIRLPEIF